MRKQKVVVVGLGKLGSRLLARMQNSRFSRQFDVAGVGRQDDLAAAVAGSAAIVIAVRPDQIAAVAEVLRGKLPAECIVVSLVSGKSGRTLRDLFGTTTIVCATTNLGAEIGKGSTVCVAPFSLKKSCKRLADRLFGNWGKIYWRTDDSELPKCVIADGCMPAIHIHNIEGSIQSHIELGLEPELATALVMDSLEAFLALYRSNPARGLAGIREAVVTPNGVTEKILARLVTFGSAGRTAAFRSGLLVIERILGD